MFKALLKRQLLELNSFYFHDSKKGKNRTKAQAAGFIALFALIFIGLGISFFFIGIMLANTLVPAGFGWIYLAIMGLLAMALGIIGSVFNTYSGLYKAKDNELLLSLPIPPSYILGVRLAGVYFMGMMYELIVMVPACIAYWIAGARSMLQIIFPILLIFLLGIVILTLTAFFGWIIAVISGKLKNRSFVTIIVSVALFGIYYYGCLHFNNMLEAIMAHSMEYGTAIINGAYPMYLFGRAGEGDIISLLLFTAFACILLAATWFILSKSFLKISSMKDASEKKEYTAEDIKVKNLSGTLFNKELKRFTSSSTYMLNCALGTLAMPILAVLAIIFRGKISDTISVYDIPSDFIPVLVLTIMVGVLAMNDITAPSISLEGRNLWILQTLPIETRQIFDSKKKLHLAFTLPPAVLLSICICFAAGVPIESAILIAVLTVIYSMASASCGLALNLKMPNLTWTRETAPIKHSMAVNVCLFGGWLVAVVISVAGLFALKHMNTFDYLIIWLVVFTLGGRYINKWLYTSGVDIFRSLIG